MDAAAGGVEVALLPWPELAADVVDAPQPAVGELASEEDAECKEDEERRLARLRELLKQEAAAWAESAAEVRTAQPSTDTARPQQSACGSLCGSRARITSTYPFRSAALRIGVGPNPARSDNDLRGADAAAVVFPGSAWPTTSSTL